MAESSGERSRRPCPRHYEPSATGGEARQSDSTSICHSSENRNPVSGPVGQSPFCGSATHRIRTDSPFDSAQGEVVKPQGEVVMPYCEAMGRATHRSHSWLICCGWCWATPPDTCQPTRLPSGESPDSTCNATHSTDFFKKPHVGTTQWVE